jgi:hypothetical protein
MMTRMTRLLLLFILLGALGVGFQITSDKINFRSLPAYASASTPQTHTASAAAAPHGDP